MAGITLRRATLEDARDLFEWRNAAETRRFFFDPKALVWADHLAWLQETLQRPDRHLLIGELRGEVVGVLRFDTAAPVAEVSVYLVPGRAGQGLGTQLLKAGSAWLVAEVPEVAAVEARILPQNLASRKAFAKAGFRESEGKYLLMLSRAREA